jgi:hypothetical protein
MTLPATGIRIVVVLVMDMEGLEEDPQEVTETGREVHQAVTEAAQGAFQVGVYRETKAFLTGAVVRFPEEAVEELLEVAAAVLRATQPQHKPQVGEPTGMGRISIDGRRLLLGSWSACRARGMAPSGTGILASFQAKERLRGTDLVLNVSKQ